MDKEQARRRHEVEGRIAERSSKFQLEIVMKFTRDTPKVYRDLIIRIKNNEMSVDEAIEYLDKVDASLEKAQELAK